MTKFLDLFLRRLNSILFRIVICSYALAIILFEENYLPTIAYIVITIVYFVLYLQLLEKSFLRLTLDFAFILCILLFKNPLDPLTFVFTLLPIINNVNFSGDKKSKLLYLYTTIVFLSSYFFYHGLQFHLSKIVIVQFSIPVIILWAINTYTTQRLNFRNFKEDLNDLIDEYFLHPESVRKPHKIYEQLILRIHQGLNKNFISGIYCFVPSPHIKNKLVLANGSKFIWRYSFSKPDLLERLRKNGELLNEPISLDGSLISKNIILISNVEGQEYIYVFQLLSSLNLRIQIGFPKLLSPVLTRVSKVLSSDRVMQDIRRNELLKLMHSIQYVDKANKTMHFIRNRLTPFSNLLALLNANKTVSDDKVNQLNLLLESEIERTATNLKSIELRANNMLEKSNNPFIYSEVTTISIQKLFITLKRIFNHHFPELEIELSETPQEKMFVSVNEDGIEVFFSDWISNMEKYKKNIAYCSFSINGEELKICFRNNHNLNNHDLQKIISDLMSNDRNEIMRRTTHGLYIIKTSLEDMGIKFEVKQIKLTDQLEFLLILKIIK